MNFFMWKEQQHAAASLTSPVTVMAAGAPRNADKPTKTYLHELERAFCNFSAYTLTFSKKTHKPTALSADRLI